MKRKTASPRTRATKNSEIIKPPTTQTKQNSEQGQIILPNEIQREANRMIHNGMTEALLGFDPRAPIGVQLSQVDTLFRNNRWYLVSNMRQLLSEIFVEIGLIQRIVETPVDDGFRGGVDIKTKQLDEDEIQELIAMMERKKDLETVARAIKWNRLFGGAGVIIMTNQDPQTPLDIEKIKEGSPLEFKACDLWELFWSLQSLDGDYTDIEIEDDEMNEEMYNYYNHKVHNSRVMRMKGLEPPSFIRPRLRGWGFSVVESLVRSINQYLKATDLTFEVLDEFKVDIFKIKNLNNTLLKPDGHEKVRQRVALANREKNYQNAITMDMEDDYDHKQLSFSGLAEVMEGIRMQVASDMCMPLTKLFGISAQGFSSGQDDIENYNAMIESQVRQKAKYDIMKVIELRCQQLFGMRPDDLTIEFKPLRILSAEQEENVKTQQFTRILGAKTAGEITTKEFRDACNRHNLLGISLDVDSPALNPDELDQGDDVGDEESDSTEKPTGGKPMDGKAKKASSSAKPAPKAKD